MKATFPTVNSEAYTLYTEAYNIYQSHAKQNFLYGIQLLDAAVKLDSSFADAYALQELLCADLANDAKINKNRSIHVGTFWAKESDY